MCNAKSINCNPDSNFNFFYLVVSEHSREARINERNKKNYGTQFLLTLGFFNLCIYIYLTKINADCYMFNEVCVMKHFLNIGKLFNFLIKGCKWPVFV